MPWWFNSVGFDVWLAFVVASGILNFMPGPSMMLIIAHAISKGAHATASTICGIVAGDVILIALSLFGVGAVLAASAELFVLMKWLGVLYLIYLGVVQWNALSVQRNELPRRSGVDIGGFRDGMIVTLLNPKVIAFHIAFFPQFVDQRAELAPQMVVLGATFVVGAAIAMTFYAVAAEGARRLFRGPGLARLVNRISGGVLVGSGLFMSMLQRS